jgi:hypothetical protein
MLFKVAFVLLIAWLLGVLGLYRVGDLVHVLLLVGLMLLLLAFLRARDAAVRRAIGGRADNHDPDPAQSGQLHLGQLVATARGNGSA